MEQVWVFGIVVVIAIVVAIVAAVASAKRRRALEATAERLGLEFSPDPHNVEISYSGFAPFDRGNGRRCRNLLHGRRGDLTFELFDYRFSTGSGKNRKTHHYGIAAAQAPMNFRMLQIRPEGFFDRLAAMVGYDDINFESEQFSRRYHVSCDVRKFAFDLIHPQMIEFLLRCPPRHWQLRGPIILIHRSGHFSAAELEECVAMIEGFVQRIPPYVRQDIGQAVSASPNSSWRG